MQRRLVSLIALFYLAILCACGSDGLPLNDKRRVLDVVPPRAQKSRIVSRVAPDEQLELRVALPLRSEQDLDAHLTAISRAEVSASVPPWTPEAFADAYHPTGEAWRVLKAHLIRHHLDFDDEAHGTLLGVRGRVADIEQAFGVTLQHYEDEFGQLFRAPLSHAEVDDTINIRAIHGLTTISAPRSFARGRPADLARQYGKNRQASAPLSAAQIRAAYNIPAPLSGAVVKVGLLQLSGYDPNDINRYAAMQGQVTPPITTILVDTAQAARGTPFQEEVTADIEMVMAAVPSVAEIRLYTGPATASEQQMLDLYNEMASPTLGDRQLFLALSTSYGQFEDELSASDLDSKNAIFAQMAAQGQTLFAAAGDTGAFANANQLTVIDPAIEPWVCGVGGTRLLLGANGSYQSESAWSEGGGGVSSHFAMPSYQSGLVLSGGNRSQSMRNSPDVALNADPNSPYSVQYQGTSYLFGGTSLAAPLWAGIWAIAQAERQQLGMPAFGHFNTVLYSLMRAGFGPSTLNDITVGNNGFYPATTSYDDATGWGTPNAAVLLNVVANSFPKHTVRAPSWSLTP